ncbi:hypothetical protein [Anabaena sp. CCY 9402-a]|uniref:hypothetical protein n=1 Tax=Anabaena sp. CCY 9402-a TaxID=3103867 RepID=UPI0039C757D0
MGYALSAAMPQALRNGLTSRSANVIGHLGIGNIIYPSHLSPVTCHLSPPLLPSSETRTPENIAIGG